MYCTLRLYVTFEIYYYNIGISLSNVKIRIIKINFHFGILEKLEKTFNRMIKNAIHFIKILMQYKYCYKYL